MTSHFLNSIHMLHTEVLHCNSTYFVFAQGKFIRIHFGPSGKLAGADIETCKLFYIFKIIGILSNKYCY